MNYKNVLDNILEIFPNFRPYYEEHIKDNGQILSHVLMGDLQRYFLNSFRSENLEECKKIILFLDSLLSKDPKIQELVYYSFLENLPQDNKEEYNKIVKLFTPNLRKALAEVDAFWENMGKKAKEI